MLFVTYWELNEEMSVETRQKAARKLVEGGHFPPEGVEVIRWDATPDGWGVLIVEADSVQAVQETIGMWRIAGRGFFRTTRTAPAMPVQEVMENTEELLEAMG